MYSILEGSENLNFGEMHIIFIELLRIDKTEETGNMYVEILNVV